MTEKTRSRMIPTIVVIAVVSLAFILSSGSFSERACERETDKGESCLRLCLSENKVLFLHDRGQD